MHYEEWKAKRRQQAAEEREPVVEPMPSASVTAPPVAADGLEGFQWNEERDKAIQDLLDSTVPGTMPAVHVQLQAIRHAIIEKSVSAERAFQLLAEVDQYLNQLLLAEQAKPPVDHDDVSNAREDKMRALSAWREASTALRQYAEDEREVLLDVAAYAADQGSAFLATARRLLLHCEPEPEFEDDDE